jgi:hypothetical protein
MTHRAAALLLSLLLATPLAAETLRVGPGERFATPSAAARAARDADTVLIAPGTYRDCAVWRAAGLTIAAMPGGAVEITGPVCGDKALFVTVGPRISITGIGFRGATSTAGNGAGIRMEGADLTVRNARFIDNQNGILTSANIPQGRLLIEDSLFRANGALLRECAHGLYAGRLALVTIRRSRFEDTRICHHVKSRAARTEILDSVIADGDDRLASYLVDIPNGGDLLLRNSELRKGPRAENTEAAVVIGAEGVTHPTGTLEIFGNRFTNLMPRGTVFVRNRSATPVLLQGNTISGQVTVLEGPGQVR